MKLSEINSLLNKLPTSSRTLPPSFYLQKTVIVAKKLLGKVLFIQHQGEIFLSEIVETEAYLSRNDPACHTHKGLSKKNKSMFEVGGTCYVYLCYGLNYCMNVVTQKKGCGEAVLIRAVKPLQGVKKMADNRKIKLVEKPNNIIHLTNGPGKLTQALGIDSSFDGVRFDHPNLKILDCGRRITKSEITVASRIGITKNKDAPYRFFVKGCPFVSRKA